MPPLMLLMAIALFPLGVWMIVRRPEKNWEKEVREEHERRQGRTTS